MYITKGDIQNFILQDIDSSLDSFITDVIDMVGTYIDDYCDTTFASVASEARYFDGSGQNDLVVDDFQAVTAVGILDVQGNVIMNLTEGVDYVSYPLNSSPKSRLRLLRGGQIISWPKQNYAVKVTATWGSGTVPGPIKLVALQLAAKVLDRGLKGGMHVDNERLGEYQVRYKDVDEAAVPLGVYDILDGYRRIGLD